MDNIKFEIIGNGNCLYNSTAVWLAYAKQQNLLTPSMQNNSPLMAKLAEISSSNWVKVQLDLADTLRAMVIAAIENDKTVQAEVFKILGQALDQSIVISTPENIITGHFEDMPVIKEKIASLITTQNKEELRKWFFEGDAIGLKEYLHGEKGIAKSGVNAGPLEFSVLSKLLAVIIKYQGNVIDGFKPIEEAKKHQANALVFSIEKSSAHWNVLFPETENCKKIIEDYLPQRQKYIKMQILKEILAAHGSYAAHLAQMLDSKHYGDDFTESTYCEMFSLTKVQFKENIIPGEVLVPVVNNEPSSVTNATPKENHFYVAFWLTFMASALLLHSFALPLLIGVADGIVLTLLLSGSLSYFIAEKLIEQKPQTAAASPVLLAPAAEKKPIEAQNVLKQKPDLLFLYRNDDKTQAKSAETPVSKNKNGITHH